MPDSMWHVQDGRERRAFLGTAERLASDSQKYFPFEENVSNKCSQLLRCKPSERTLKALSVTCVDMSSYVLVLLSIHFTVPCDGPPVTALVTAPSSLGPQ